QFRRGQAPKLPPPDVERLGAVRRLAGGLRESVVYARCKFQCLFDVIDIERLHIRPDVLRTFALSPVILSPPLARCDEHERRLRRVDSEWVVSPRSIVALRLF